MRKPVLSLLLPLSLLFLASGCVEKEDFAYCPFDPCIYAQCSEDPGGPTGTRVAYSCSVLHSQCRKGICLRYEGSNPFCTEVCDPANGDADCPLDSTCREYLSASADRAATYYCVPTEVPPAVSEDVGVCNTLP